MGTDFEGIRFDLIRKNRFFGALSLRYEVKVDPTAKTAWTNGKVIGYNPRFTASLTHDEMLGLWAHEVLHCVLLHHTRRGSRNPEKWNVAADYVINALLTRMGFRLPKGGLMRDLSHLSVEQAYALLESEEREKENGEGKNGEGKNGEDKNGEDKGFGKGENFGEIRDASSNSGKEPTPEEIAAAEEDWKHAITQSMEMNRNSIGKELGSILEQIAGGGRSVVSWTDVLRNFLTSLSKRETNWQRPSRRAHGDYIPYCGAATLGNIVIAIDTSGSVNSDLLAQFTLEINQILTEYDGKVTVVQCDTKVHDCTEYTSNDVPFDITVKGRGGTEFTPVFTYINEEGLRPDALIYLTDLECLSYGQEPEYPVLWVYSNHNDWYATLPPYGEVCRMGEM